MAKFLPSKISVAKNHRLPDTVTTERQIAANRRNALKSTGPRSDAGKRRARRNSFRHGLAAAGTATAERIKPTERLARKIAGATTDIVALECARTIVQAEFDLAQIQWVKVALISRVMVFGGLETPAAFRSLGEIRRFLKGLDRGELIPERVEAPAMPTTEPERTAEAIRRAMPKLIMLDRYERRAAGRRARALRRFLECKNTNNYL